MTARDLLNVPDSELLAVCQPTKCDTCGVTLHESTTGIRKVAREDASACPPNQSGRVCICSDCYFDRFNAHIECHPIGRPRMHRPR